MLLKKVYRTTDRRLALAVRSAACEAVLAALLRQWGYRIAPSAAADLLLVTEAGLPSAAPSGPVLRLVPTGSAGTGELALPMKIGDLSLALEGYFNQPPRRHLRIALNLPVAVEVRHRLERTILCSLSDRGGRFRLSQALPAQEKVVVCLPGAEESLLEGKVIYSIDRGDIGGEGFDIGVIFEEMAPSLRQELHARIVYAFLQRIRKLLPAAVFAEGTALFRLPPERILSSADPFPGELPTS